MSNFEGKVALVTGGGSGMGRATAVMFAKRGAKVTVSDYSEQAGAQTVRMIREAGGEAIFVQADVRVAQQVEEMVMKTVEQYGRLDAAFNNAGVGGPWARLAQISEEDFDKTLDTNLKGVFLCMKYEIPVMQRQGGGVIINNASSSANRAADRSYIGIQRQQVRRCRHDQCGSHRVRQGPDPHRRHLSGVDQDPHHRRTSAKRGYGKDPVQFDPFEKDR